MLAIFLLVCLGLLNGCTAKSVGPLTYDRDGNAYTHYEVTSEYDVLCNGSCLKQRGE